MSEIKYQTTVKHRDGSTTEVLSPPVHLEEPPLALELLGTLATVPLTVGRKYSEPLGKDSAWVSIEISATVPVQIDLDPKVEIAVDAQAALVEMRRRLSALLDQEMLAEMECALDAHERVRVMIVDRQARLDAREKASSTETSRPAPRPVSRPAPRPTPGAPAFKR